MKENKDVLRYLKEDAKKIEIPESITPLQVRKQLEKVEQEKKETSKILIYKYLVAAACVCLVIGMAFAQKTSKKSFLATQTGNTVLRY